jgi:hypothetical protein
MSVEELVEEVKKEQGRVYSLHAESVEVSDGYNLSVFLRGDQSYLAMTNGVTKEIEGNDYDVLSLTFLVKKDKKLADQVYQEAKGNYKIDPPLGTLGINPDEFNRVTALLGLNLCHESKK